MMAFSGFFPASEWVSSRQQPLLVPRCGSCGLYQDCRSPKMPVAGQGKRKILVIGEAPGQTEDRIGRPFVGYSGELLRGSLALVGVDLDKDCWTTNSLICHPKESDGSNRTPSDKEISYCRPNLIRTIKELEPETIIPLGGSAVKSLIGWLWKEEVGPVGRWVGWQIPSQRLNAWVCHPAEVEVTTRDGLVTIDRIEVGDSVLTHTGNWERVSEVFRRKYTGGLIGLKRAYSSVPLEATPEHPLLISSQGGHFEWQLAAHVSVGDYLLEPIPSSPEEPLDGQVVWSYVRPPGRWGSGRKARGEYEVRASRHLMRLLGYYLAEGYQHDKGRCTTFAFHAKEQGFQEEVSESFREVFRSSNAITLRTREGTNGVELMCFGAVGSAFFGTVGTGARDKKFPSWVWECSDDLLRELLRGLWNGDGWVSDGRILGLQLASRQLIEDVRRLLLRFGILGNLRVRKRSLVKICGGKEFMRKEAWEITVRGEWASLLAPILGVDLPKLPSKRSAKRDVFIVGGYAHYKVERIGIRRTVEECEVFNLEVDNDHSYLAGGVVSHNCPTWHPSAVLRNERGQQDEVMAMLFRRHLTAACELEGRPWQEVPDYGRTIECIQDPGDAADAVDTLRQCGTPMAWDVETDRLKPDHQDSRIVCCSLGDGGKVVSFPWHGKAIKAMEDFLRSNVPKIGYNCKFETRWSKRILGITPRNWVWDGMLAAHVLDNRPGICSVKFQSFTNLGVDSWDDAVKPFFKAPGSNEPNRIREVGLPQLLRYCGMDSLMEWHVAHRQARQLGIKL